VLGYGGGGDAPEPPAGKRRQESDNSGQDPASPGQVIGAGELTPAQRQRLTATEQRNFSRP
ncbi:hypothetical protein J8J20_25470, partial [Mycobacterium tuberculosis]|nr:hypothetical protein [Mycobacterium tuberculosis]